MELVQGFHIFDTLPLAQELRSDHALLGPFLNAVLAVLPMVVPTLIVTIAHNRPVIRAHKLAPKIWYRRRYESTERRMTRQRTLVVQIDEVAIEDGEIVPPSLGDVIEFPLRFVEQPATDANTVTIRALLEASALDPVFQYTGHDSLRRWEWNGLLRGDGWTASWRGSDHSPDR